MFIISKVRRFYSDLALLLVTPFIDLLIPLIIDSAKKANIINFIVFIDSSFEHYEN